LTPVTGLLAAVLLAALAAAFSGCGDQAAIPAGGYLPGAGGSSPGTPYDELMDGRAASSPDGGAVSGDSGLDSSHVSDGSHDSHDSGGDAAFDGGGSGPDAGPKTCPVDIFASSRPSGDVKIGGRVDGKISGDCDVARHPLILAAGQTVHVELWGERLTADLRVYGPGRRGYLFQNIKYSLATLATIEFTADIPGEYFVIAAQNGRRGESPYHLSVDCKENCGLIATRYPVVMVHGFFGFENVGPIEYFWKVKDTLGPKGYDIHISVTDAFNSTEKRGVQLAANISAAIEKTFAEKVNVVAHSQGGLDTRYIISGLGYAEKVGMLNMVASPHRGTAIADAIVSDPTGIGAPLLNAIGVIFGAVLTGPEAQQNMMASMNALTTWNMKKFNELYPDDPRVKYRSWAGKSCYSWESGCVNPVNVYLMPTFQYLRGAMGDNDGIVGSDSCVWTGFQDYINADHFDEVGQLLGATGAFDHLAFYTLVFDTMRAAGY
jgi:triacylglycerol esterase/lipase EstA (alpha/beta hydrolase family)